MALPYYVPGAGTDTYGEPTNSFVYWDLQRADGSWFPLHTYAWSVKSFGGRRFMGAPKRGDNLAVPFRRGRLYVPKTRESQNYDINMWVFPLNQDGSKDPNKTIEQKAHENWRKIIAAVDQEGEFRLRKRWYDEASSLDDFKSGANVKSAVAMAEFLDGSGPGSDDGKDFYIDLTFTLADPYFYDNQIFGTFTASDKVATATTLNLNSTTNVPLRGDTSTTHVYIEIALTGSYPTTSYDPLITFADGNYIKLQASSLTNQSGYVTIDCHNGIAAQTSLTNYLNGGAITNYVNGLIVRNPKFLTWPTIDPRNGVATTPIRADGTGTIKVVYDAAFR